MTCNYQFACDFSRLRLFHSDPLVSSMCCECQILQALFTHNVCKTFILFLIARKGVFRFHLPSKLFRCSYVPSILFSASFCGTTSVLCQASSSSQRKLPNIHSRIRRLILHDSCLFFGCLFRPQVSSLTMRK